MAKSMYRLIITLISLLLCINVSYVVSAQITGQNCAITLGGQKFHSSGGSGGIANTPGGSLIDFSTIIKSIDEQLVAVNYGAQPVAILVVDDFAGDEPQQALAAGNSLDGISVSHGRLVYEHINRLVQEAIANLGVNQLTQQEMGNLETYWSTNNGLQIHVIGVDVRNYDTAVIAKNVSSTIDNLKQQGVFRFIVNMSFVILPCDTVQDFLTVSGGTVTFEDYVRYLMSNKPISDFKEWIKTEIDRVNLTMDPLRRYIQNLLFEQSDPDIQNIIFIASAGNYGTIDEIRVMDFPLLPGGWDEVVAVGGLESDNISSNRTPWIFSNGAEVVAPAAWYEYTPPNGSPTGAYYAGTSFAAPLIAVMAAFQLSADVIACPFDTMPPIFAVTSYPNLSDTPTLDDIRLGKWRSKSGKGC